MSKETKIIKSVIIVMAFAAVMILLGLVYSQVNRIQKDQSQKKNDELKSAIRKEYNDYGLLGDAVLSNEVKYEVGDYVIYSDHIAKKLSILEESPQETLSRAQALSDMFPDKPVVILPVPKRIMTEEKTYGSRETYSRMIRQLRGLNDNKNILIADPSAELEQATDFPFFRTKDGWTMNGAYYGYQKVMTLLGSEYCDLEHFDYYQNNVFSGGLKSECRQAEGYTSKMEEVVDAIPTDPFVYRISREFKDYELVYDRKAQSTLKAPVISPLTQSVVSDGIDYAILEGNGSGIMLIIGDGESKMMAPFYTEHYEKVIYIDISECKTESFTSMIADYKVDAVVIAQAVDKLGVPAYSKVLNGLVKKDGNNI